MSYMFPAGGYAMTTICNYWHPEETDFRCIAITQNAGPMGPHQHFLYMSARQAYYWGHLIKTALEHRAKLRAKGYIL